MDDQTLSAIIQIVGLLVLVSGGGLLAWKNWPTNKRKTEVEIENTLALTVANLGVEIARLTTSLDEERQKRRKLEDEFESMKDEHQTLKMLNTSLRKGVKILSKQLTANDIKPEYTLPD